MDKILIRYGELSTKGNNKMSFIRQLANNMKKLINIDPEVHYDRMFIEYSESALNDLKYIFGIYSYSPVLKVKTNMKDIEKSILYLTKDTNCKTFKIAARRNWKKFEKNSNELNNLLGGLVLKNSDLKVKIKNPDMKIEVEIRQNYSYVFITRILGSGGYPTGINGKTLHLMSGGIDSPVAAYELMKRGIHVDYLNFITPPHTDDKTIDKVNRLVTMLNKYQGTSTIYRINYTDLMNLIGLTSKQSYKINLMRRSFYRIANSMAINKKYLAISNGDNIGQVASQTMESLLTISNQATLPIYRPLLTADKIDTIKKAKNINTYDISIEKANESCEIFAPKKPTTKPFTSESEKLEKDLVDLFELEHKAMLNINKVEIKIKQ